MILALGITAGELSAFIGILIFCIAITGGVVTYVLKRRETTGTTETSDAAVLWDQSQKMREDLVRQIDKLTEQRDKLMELQSSQTIPVLRLITDALREITESLTRIEGKINAKR